MPDEPRQWPDCHEIWKTKTRKTRKNPAARQNPRIRPRCRRYSRAFPAFRPGLGRSCGRPERSCRPSGRSGISVQSPGSDRVCRSSSCSCFLSCPEIFRSFSIQYTIDDRETLRQFACLPRKRLHGVKKHRQAKEYCIVRKTNGVVY